MGSSSISFPHVPRIIGLTGFKRSGKDTVAGILGDHCGHSRVALADPLRGIALACDPWIDVVYPNASSTFERLSVIVKREGWEKAKDQAEVRRFLQKLGTEGVRDNLGDSTWIDAMKRKLPLTARVVITDVRFPNEAEAVHMLGGQLWRVRRPGEMASAHISEVGQAGIIADYTIENNGTLEELRHKVLEAIAFYAPVAV